MSIFDFFLSKINIHNQQLNLKDERKAECPNCGQTLYKIPGAKTRCPHCGKFMFVRTRPKDNSRVVVTKEEADKIDEEWSIVDGTHDIFITKKEEFAEHRNKLKKQFGKEPLAGDIQWSIYSKRIIQYAQKGDWGLYRNNRFDMAEHLWREKRFKHALITYLEVCFLDTNGPNNLSGINDPDILKAFPRFDPTVGSETASGVVDLIKIIANKLNLTREKIKELFIAYNSRVAQNLKTPLSAEESWLILEKKLFIL